MTCPGELQLDLWLDHALAVEPAAEIAAHLTHCSACSFRRRSREAEEHTWRAALALQASELAPLWQAQLASAWQTGRLAHGPARWWPALVLVSLVGSYLAWQLALPALAASTAVANRLGLTGVGIAWGLGRLWDAAMAATAALAPVGSSSLAYVAATCLGLWLLAAQPWKRATRV
jgi:hypothetical protein